MNIKLEYSKVKKFRIPFLLQLSGMLEFYGVQ